MAIYIYTSDDGDSIELNLPIAKRRKSIRRNGKTYYRDIPAEWNHRRNVTCKNWPMLSDALGVHRSQIKEAVELHAKAGIDVDFHKDGRCIVRDNAHRNQLMEFAGLHDKDAGYMQRAKP